MQRGSAQFLSICPGDPRTPECGGTLKDHIPSIPVQPIGYGDAEPILKNLGGNAAPAHFQGGFSFPYTVGGDASNNVVTLSVLQNVTVTPIWNVCAEVTGRSPTFVLAGSHRDAWAFGAVDPNSSSSVLLEIARALGILKAQGFVPDRTIRMCSWDAEEYGLLGSTAYALSNKQDLSENCVAYFNSDVGVAGRFLSAGASPSLAGLMQAAAEKVVDPYTKLSLSHVFKFKAFPRGSLQVLGSGSDYTSFLSHLGVPSADYGFVGEDALGEYHSAYDDFFWMTHFGAENRTFVYYQVLAQFTGSLLINASSRYPFLYFACLLDCSCFSVIRFWTSSLLQKHSAIILSLFRTARLSICQAFLQLSLSFRLPHPGPLIP